LNSWSIIDSSSGSTCTSDSNQGIPVNSYEDAFNAGEFIKPGKTDHSYDGYYDEDEIEKFGSPDFKWSGAKAATVMTFNEPKGKMMKAKYKKERALGDKRNLYHSAYCPPPDAHCHPASTTLELEDGTSRRIDQVAVGDVIRTEAGYEPITALMHAEHGKRTNFFRFHTKDASMAITQGHYIFVNGVERDPATVKEGEMLTTRCCGEQPIERIERTTEEGSFHITTSSTTYYADGVLSSTYVAMVPLNVWKVAGGIYPYVRYMLGVPLTPEGAGGPLSIFWLLNAYEAMGLPMLARGVLWPVTMISTLFAELVNTAVVQCPVSGTTALALLSAFAMRMRK